ncbi:MAG: MgtC/SapB family protein [Gaiellaceae bacterium]
MPDLATWEILVRLAAAAALGGVIGIERELREREAGFRTHMLVSVGAALFTIVSAYAWTDFTFSQASGVTFDPTRIAAQIVTGIGFIGAGAIIRQGLTVRGLTTAATLWLVAAIGMACGAGFYWAAVIAATISLVSLGPLRVVSRRVGDRTHRRELEVDLEPDASAAPVLAALEQLGVSVTSFSMAAHGDGRRLSCIVELPQQEDSAELVLRLGELAEVSGVKWNR